MKVTARITGLERQDEALEQLFVRLSLEAGVSSVFWAIVGIENSKSLRVVASPPAIVREIVAEMIALGLGNVRE